MVPKRNKNDFESMCRSVDQEDGIPSHLWRKKEHSENRRKTNALCKQVAQAVSFALSGEVGDELLNSLYVESVEPVPDLSRLMVTVTSVTGDAELDPREVQARLNKLRSLFRMRVAESIHRKKVPDLTFRCVLGQSS